jgi:hypothetical protein
MSINDVSGQVVDAAMKVHTVLGPGLLESAYEGCLVYELRESKPLDASEFAVPLNQVRDGRGSTTSEWVTRAVDAPQPSPYNADLPTSA